MFTGFCDQEVVREIGRGHLIRGTGWIQILGIAVKITKYT